MVSIDNQCSTASNSIVNPATRYRVQDILSGKKEEDKVIYNDDTVIIVPDSKWDMTTVSTLYLLAIARDSNLKSMRDLRGEHIPLLKRIKEEATATVKDKWGVSAGGLRFFVHYQPSYCEFGIFVDV